MVSVNDVITAINGIPMLGYDTTIVANVLQSLPACVTMRFVKHGVEFVPAIARTQVCGMFGLTWVVVVRKILCLMIADQCVLFVVNVLLR